MNQSSINETPQPPSTPKTPPVESELKRFAKLLDEFFATVAI